MVTTAEGIGAAVLKAAAVVLVVVVRREVGNEYRQKESARD
jgi:hypothetical protein